MEFPGDPETLERFEIPVLNEDCEHLKTVLVNAIREAYHAKNTARVERLTARHTLAQHHIDANLAREQYRRDARARMLDSWNKASNTILFAEQVRHLGAAAEDALQNPGAAGVERLRGLLLEAECEGEAAPDDRPDIVAAATARAERLRAAIAMVSRR